MTTIFDNTAWPVALGLLFQMATEHEDWDFADALKYELGTAVETITHLELCLDLEAA